MMRPNLHNPVHPELCRRMHGPGFDRLGPNDELFQIEFTREKKMRKKLVCFALGAMLLALSFPVEAQQPKKIPRIGVLSGGGDPRSQAGDQDDPHCHGDSWRSSRDWASR